MLNFPWHEKRCYSEKSIIACFIDTTSKPACPLLRNTMRWIGWTILQASLERWLNWGYILIATLLVECVVLSCHMVAVLPCGQNVLYFLVVSPLHARSRRAAAMDESIKRNLNVGCFVYYIEQPNHPIFLFLWKVDRNLAGNQENQELTYPGLKRNR
jgi:hypothetical protein